MPQSQTNPRHCEEERHRTPTATRKKEHYYCKANGPLFPRKMITD